MVKTRNRGGSRGRGVSRSEQARSQGSVRPGGHEELVDQPPDLGLTIAEEVTKAIHDMLPTLLNALEEVIQKEQQGETRIKDQGGETSGKTGCTFKAFMDGKPTEFLGKDDPIAAMTWLTHTEKKFRTSKCAEKDKVDYATNLLTMAAHYWWEMTSSTLGEELTSMLTWEQFKVKFNEEYCSPTMIRQLEHEFSQLVQGTKTVQEYTIEFNDKARFAKHLIDTEETKIDRYKWRL